MGLYEDGYSWGTTKLRNEMKYNETKRSWQT